MTAVNVIKRRCSARCDIWKCILDQQVFWVLLVPLVLMVLLASIFTGCSGGIGGTYHTVISTLSTEMQVDGVPYDDGTEDSSVFELIFDFFPGPDNTLSVCQNDSTCWVGTIDRETFSVSHTWGSTSSSACANTYETALTFEGTLSGDALTGEIVQVQTWFYSCNNTESSSETSITYSVEGIRIDADWDDLGPESTSEWPVLDF